MAFMYSCSLTADIGLDRIDRRDRGQLLHLPRADEISYLCLGNTRDAVDRGRDPSPVEVELGLVEGRALPSMTDARVDSSAADGIVQVFLAHRVLRGKRFDTREICLCCLPACLRLGQLPLCLLEGCLEGPRVYLEEHLSLLDHVSLFIESA